MSNARTYLDRVLQVNPVPSQNQTVSTTRAVLDALTTLNRSPRYHPPTVGAIAFHAGLSYAQTQRDLLRLKAEGDVIEVEKVKADGYALRYTLTGETQ